MAVLVKQVTFHAPPYLSPGPARIDVGDGEFVNGCPCPPALIIGYTNRATRGSTAPRATLAERSRALRSVSFGGIPPDRGAGVATGLRDNDQDLARALSLQEQ